jgi:hypothetical protein
LTRGGDVGVATRVGPKVQTVLGLSMTSTSVGWALLDGQDPGAVTLDHDAFDVQSGAGLGDMSQHAAAARGAHAIAAASGHTVGSVRVTWSQDVEASATALLKSLADLEFDNVVAIPLRQATQSWAIEAGRANEHNKTALCILEPGTATVMVVATGAGSVRTAVTNAREHAADLVDWLTTIFNRDGWLPECLYLVGSDDDLDAVTAPISDGLPIPVFDSVDSRLALARGAALATVGHATVVSSPVAETPRKLKRRPDRPRPLPDVKKETTPAAAEAAAETAAQDVVGAAQSTVGHVTVVSSPVAETPRKLKPRPDRSRLLSDVKKVTTSAAAVAVVGAALSLAAGSALNGEKVSTQAANPQAAGASVTSASVHAVPAPVFSPPAPPVQALDAAPPPATPAPPETHTLPAEPLAVVEPEPVSVPVPQHTASPPANVSAAPLAAPPAPTAPPPAAPVTAPAALPPAVPAAAAAAPIAPPPAAPLAAPPAPIAPPAQAVTPDAPVPPPPPDPLQAVLSPLFSGLP